MRLTAPVFLELPNSLAVLRPLLAFVREILLELEFGQEERDEVEVALEEAVVNVVEHAYDPGEQATFRVILEPVPLGVRVVVHDDGLPLDVATLEKETMASSLSGLGVGNILMRRLMDEVSLVNRGRGGKDLELVKYFRRTPVEPDGDRDLPDPEDIRNEGRNDFPVPGEGMAVSGGTPLAPIPFTMRPFEPGDALEIARCAWRAYGYSYPNPHVFFPERMVELNARKELLSVVAVTPEGDIMGHCAAEFPDAGASTAEIGMAFVKPSYRSQGVLKDLTRYLLDVCWERGLQGTYVQSVTAHTASQRAAAAMGFLPCALLVGSYPETLDFKRLGGDPGSRLSLIVAFEFLRSHARSRCFVPPRHRPMVERLYEGLNLRPLFDAVERPDLPEHGETAVHVAEVVNAASVVVRSVGRDSAAALARVTRSLCHRRVDMIRLDLPLEDPGTPGLCGALEAQGYFFAGLFPEGDRGDKLLLQYLNNVDVDYDRIQVFSPLAQELKAYVRECDPSGKP